MEDKDKEVLKDFAVVFSIQILVVILFFWILQKNTKVAFIMFSAVAGIAGGLYISGQSCKRKVKSE